MAVAILLGLGVAFSGVPIASVLILLVAGVLARGRVTRTVLLLVAAGIFAHVPWVLVSSVAGLLAAILDRGKGLQCVRFRAIAFAVGAGLAAGAAAVPVVVGQISDAAIAVPFEKPPLGLVLPILLVAALINGFGEEYIWRSIVARRLVGLPIWGIYAVQALSFGLAHFSGVPGGAAGMVLTALFAVLATWLGRRWGVAAAVAAHMAADAVIFIAYWLSIDSLFISVVGS